MPRFVKQRGTLDIFDNDAIAFNLVIDACKKIAKLYNFVPIYTPTFEATGLYARSTGETSDIVTKEMYNFLDKGGRDITLRPEGTAGVIRAIIENKLYAINDLPLKYYYSGSFFRYERPQIGRYREFNQFGVEIVGSNSYLDDAESILMIADILKELGIKDYKVRINSFGNVDCRNKFRDAIKEFIKPHLDNLCEDCKNRYEKNPLRILDCKVDHEYLSKLVSPISLDFLDEDNKKIFNNITEILDDNNINYEIDKYLVRGLDYYTGIIFEFDIAMNDGKVLTIGGGGRYSNLVKELDGPDLSCVGFGIGVNRLSLIVEELFGKEKFKNDISCYIMPFDENAKKIGIKIASALRNNNISAEVEGNNKSISSMFKYASKHNYKYAIMLGDELKENKVKIKNLTNQEQYFVSIDDILGGKING